MDARTKLQVEGIMKSIHEALQRFYEDPQHRCTDCGKRRDVRPTAVGFIDEKGEWQVTNDHTFVLGETGCWIEAVPNIQFVGRINRKWFCPDCAPKRGIDFKKEHAR